MCPFWFWNDRLDADEIRRQIAEFQAHGVNAFVIHPRVGLPKDQGWMSPALLDMMEVAIQEAESRGMWVVLYDEGMYPSGSASGSVVAEDPRFQCRGMELRAVGMRLPEDAEILWTDGKSEIVERPIDSVIRGLHYVGGGPEEESPPAADLLNSDAMAAFIRHSYDGYQQRLGKWFGTVVRGIFTDEPSLLGRPRERGLVPSTRGILEHVRRLTGEDLQDRLPELWQEGSETRRTYDRALELRLRETYYRPLADWCKSNRVMLMGHPERPDDLAALRFFDVPGQDLVWRWVLPGKTALEGPQSTQAKAASSAMRHGGRRRNSNELAGAYGHHLTETEFRWLFHWCLVRGCNQFFPHAFYYSLRGPRRDERPPDVGPNSSWWGRYPAFAMGIERLSRLNAEARSKCRIAILDHDGKLPWRAASACFRSQFEFDYLSRENLDELRSQYDVIVVDGGDPVPNAVTYRDDQSFLGELASLTPRSLDCDPHEDLRVRPLQMDGVDLWIVHNENGKTIDIGLRIDATKTDPETLSESPCDGRLRLAPFELAILRLKEFAQFDLG